jgi:serine protease AprX
MSNLNNVRKTRRVNKITSAILGSTLAFTAVAWGVSNYSSGEEYILQGASRPALISAVQAENGVIIHEFKVIQAVSAKLTEEQVQGIAARNAMIRFFNEEHQLGLSAANPAGSMQGSLRPQFDLGNSKVPIQVGANELHKEGITGKGVTVAIIDSGLGKFSGLQQNAAGFDRNITFVNALENDALNSQDTIGHGSHITSILADSTSIFDQFGAPTGAHNGVAPDVDLVMIKAFDEKGEASYSSVLQGIEYAIENKDNLNIKVLNLAFSFPSTSAYWEDPINQALMRAWDQGITVVVPSGNSGDEKMNIGVPGNNPYVITVGALDDNETPFDVSDDMVASFSNFGPTADGFMKPELLAPGTNIRGLVAPSSALAFENAANGISGTSQATAVTSGIVALMIQQDPSLTPDEIKCRLISSASQKNDYAFANYNPVNGVVNASAAINSTAVGCANTGLNIFNDMNMATDYTNSDRFDMGAKGAIWPAVTSTDKSKEAKGAIWPAVTSTDKSKEAKGAIWPAINSK